MGDCCWWFVFGCGLAGWCLFWARWVCLWWVLVTCGCVLHSFDLCIWVWCFGYLLLHVDSVVSGLAGLWLLLCRVGVVCLPLVGFGFLC